MDQKTIAFFIFIALVFVSSIFLANGIKRSFPRMFSVISSPKVIWPAAIGLNLLDGLSTWLCLAHSGETDIEGSPLLRFLFGHFGVGASLLWGKIFLFSIICLILLKVISSHTRVVLVVFMFILCLNNFISFFLLALA